MHKKLITLILILPFCFSFFDSPASPEESPRLGVWITVFSEKNILHSKKNVDHFLEVCSDSGINDVYLQVYRSDKAYYDSDITDKTPHKNILSVSGTDLIPYLITSASKKNIDIHAWINLLSIAQNKNANIVKKFGSKVLTLDQHGRPSRKKDKKDKLDKYYIREDQFFLDPGDKEVRKYLTDISTEIITKYPGLSGLHLDYARYPAAVPFIPGSRFTSHGLSYGYTEGNLKKFKKEYGIDIKTADYSRENCGKWDAWRRDQLTALIANISKKAKKIDPELEVSCTIVSSFERAYLTTLQDWTTWVDTGMLDYVIVMDYTDDPKLMNFYARSIMALAARDKVQIGMGAYLLKNKPEVFKEQLDSLYALSPSGIVIFSYDDIVRDPSLLK